MLARNADGYLDELQALLRDERGKEVSRSTIWRAMNRAGISWKKVRLQFLVVLMIIVLTTRTAHSLRS